jgi:hypothetical protein
VREWTPTLPNELSFWELESQWTFELLDSDGRGQNSLDWKFPYIIRNVTTLTLGLRPKQRLARVRAKREARESCFMFLRMQRVWWKELSCSQANSHVGNWSPNGLLNIQRIIARAKTHWIEAFLISLENYWNVDVWNRLTWSI